jgi:hypothetical protein
MFFNINHFQINNFIILFLISINVELLDLQLKKNNILKK